MSHLNGLILIIKNSIIILCSKNRNTFLYTCAYRYMNISKISPTCGRALHILADYRIYWRNFDNVLSILH